MSRRDDMRILNILSGVAVLLTTLAFGHLLHRYFVVAPHESLHDPGFLIGMATGVTIGIFFFIGMLSAKAWPLKWAFPASQQQAFLHLASM